jgi:hypothetical protein
MVQQAMCYYSWSSFKYSTYLSGFSKLDGLYLLPKAQDATILFCLESLAPKPAQPQHDAGGDNSLLSSDFVHLQTSYP